MGMPNFKAKFPFSQSSLCAARLCSERPIHPVVHELVWFFGFVCVVSNVFLFSTSIHLVHASADTQRRGSDRGLELVTKVPRRMQGEAANN
ncbi:hypothetical protein PoB_004229500 [Plakobranchus ocellatus]|uniref:Uncharacterized protein n=1 Tax=Plakobranchus ocellatus TaxID=259542 RepID=A0AAV4B5C9_9GAST|nr:hypothetical protein PoB_004229500 [Plakobranchus ocellatus]